MKLNELISMDKEWMVKTKSLTVFTDFLDSSVITAIADATAAMSPLIKLNGTGELDFWFKATNDFHIMVKYSELYAPMWTVTHYRLKCHGTMFRETLDYYRTVRNTVFTTAVATARKDNVDFTAIYFKDTRMVALMHIGNNELRWAAQLPIPDTLLAKRKKPVLKSV